MSRELFGDSKMERRPVPVKATEGRLLSGVICS
jgi:hypothetical protein